MRQWLFATAVAVTVTIAVGGGTRLTESGLSITEWKPVTGVLPPLNEAHWADAYGRYLQIPEAQSVHRGITLDEFKTLYWWEWAHRLAGRLAGLVIAVPFLVLWWRGRIPQALFPRLASLPILVAAQGTLGWYMVRSGLTERTSVSPYRLVAHLSLALLILGIAVWTGASQWSPLSPERSGGGGPVERGRRPVYWAVAAVVVTILSGGFVAGLDAGRIFNEFPLMGGRVVPAGYGAMDGWRNVFENPIAAQFNHRVIAVTTALGVWVTWLVAVRRRWSLHRRRWLRLAALAAAVQVALGIATLLFAVPTWLGVAHQLGAVALLICCLMASEPGPVSS